MGVNIDTIFRITANVNGLESVKELQNEVKKISTTTENAARGFSLIGKAAIAFIGLKIGQSVKGWVTDLINMGDHLNDLGARLNVSAVTLSGWKLAAEQSGLGLDDLATGIKKFNVSVVEAMRNPGGDKASLLGQLTNIKDAAGNLRPTKEILLDVADAFANLKDDAVKSAVAIALFGKNGDAMVPFLNQGREAIEKTDYAFSAFFIKMSDEYNDAMGELGAQSAQTGSQILEGLLPAINSIIESFTTLSSKTSSTSGLVEILKGLLMGVGEAARYIALGVNIVIVSIKGLASSLYTLADATAAIFRKGDSAAKAWQRGNDRIAQMGQDFVTSTSVLFSKESGSLTGALFGITDPRTEKEKAGPVGDKKGLQVPLDASITKGLDQKIMKINAEAASMKLNNLEKEIAVNLAELESAGIKKGTAAYEKYASALVGALTARERAKESKALDDYLFKQDQELEALQDEAKYIGMTTIEIKKLQEARKIDQELQEKSRTMTKEGAAELKAATEAVKEHRLAVLQFNYDQSRTFSTGAANAFSEYVENASNAATSAKEIFGKAFNGMEDALVEFTTTGKLNFKDMARSIIADLVRIQVRQSIVMPLLRGFSSFFGFGGGVTELGNAMPWLGGGASFANGGIMGPNGSIPLMKYAGGGVADRPQLALFGEGRMKEAFVPLPDGRSIPVTMKGGGGSGDIVVNVNVSNQGSTESTQGTNKDGMEIAKTIATITKAMLINEMRPGGVLNRASSKFSG